MAFRFEQLQIWELAIEFASHVYEVTEGFPKSEIFGLRSDIRRAGNSVPMNIGEGAGRGSKRDFSRFLDIAMGSVYEVVTGMAIALKRHYITAEAYRGIYDEAEILAKKLTRFQDTLLPSRKGVG
jgi:four helix bundle protein